MVLEAPFEEEITGMGYNKTARHKRANSPYYENKYSLEIGQHLKSQMIHRKPVTFDLTQMLGVVNLRTLGYYKIKQGVLQQNLSLIYHFESANKVRDQFNKLINYSFKKRGKNAEYRKVPMAG